jgi:hypothetical protein
MSVLFGKINPFSIIGNNFQFRFGGIFSTRSKVRVFNFYGILDGVFRRVSDGAGNNM